MHLTRMSMFICTHSLPGAGIDRLPFQVCPRLTIIPDASKFVKSKHRIAFRKHPKNGAVFLCAVLFLFHLHDRSCDLPENGRCGLISIAAVLCQNSHRIFRLFRREKCRYPAVTVLGPVNVTAPGLGGGGFRTHRDVRRSALEVLVGGSVTHQPAEKCRCFRCNSRFRDATLFPQHRPAVIRDTTHQPHCRERAVSGDGTGHSGDLQGRCRQNALPEGKVRLFRRKFQLL